MTMKSTLTALLCSSALAGGGCVYRNHSPNSLAGVPSRLSESHMQKFEQAQVNRIRVYGAYLDSLEALSNNLGSDKAYAAWVADPLSTQQKAYAVRPQQAHLMNYFGKELDIFVEIPDRERLHITLANNFNGASHGAAFLTGIFEKAVTPDMHVQMLSTVSPHRYGSYSFFVAAPASAHYSVARFSSTKHLGFPSGIPAEEIDRTLTLRPGSREPKASFKGTDFYEAIRWTPPFILTGGILASIDAGEEIIRTRLNAPIYPLKYVVTDSIFRGERDADRCFREFAQQVPNYPTTIVIRVTEEIPARILFAVGNSRDSIKHQDCVAWFEPVQGDRGVYSFRMQDGKPVQLPLVGDPVEAGKTISGKR